MSGSRFSIIPRGAVHDRRLEARDFRLLALLGIHADVDSGWCRRSQVRMAGELGCARSSVRESLKRLVEFGWIEWLPVFRDSGGDAAHEYRIVLDGPESGHGPGAGFDPENPGAGGGDSAADDGEGGGAAAPGVAGERQGVATHGAPPSVTTPVKREEREARATPEDQEGLDALIARWPTASTDNPRRLSDAWGAMERADRKAAADRAQELLDEFAAQKRRNIPALTTYLRDRLWTQLDRAKAVKAKATPVGALVRYAPMSKLWWAAQLWSIDRGAPPAEMRRRLNLARSRVGFAPPEGAGPDIEALAGRLVPVFHASANGEAWRGWLRERGLDLDHEANPPPMFLRAEWPPGETESVEDMARAMRG